MQNSQKNGSEPEHKHRRAKWKKKILEIFARLMDLIGWLGFLYFFWELPNFIGMVLSLVLIIAGIILEVLLD